MEAVMEEIRIEKYPAYKDSGVEWLGNVPEHWELTRLGTRFIERRTKVSDKDYPPLSVTKQGILPQLDSAAKTNDGDNRKLVKFGDFVINSRSDRKGSSGIASADGSVSLINTVIEPINIHPIYCNYLLKSHAFVEEFYRMGHGIVADLWTTRYDEMKAILVAIPTNKEQKKIAHFLNNKTEQIDKAIAQKEKLIELLKERRQILIHNAVTRGLNPDVPMKDSGVEWIGEIPEHWEVAKLGFYTSSIQTGPFGGQLHSHDYIHKGVPVINPSHIVDGEIVPDDNQTITTSKHQELKHHTLSFGDIVFGRRGEMGRCAIFKSDSSPMICGTGSIKICLNQKMINPFYLNAFLKIENIKAWFSLNSVGSTMENLNSKILSIVPIIVPPVEEQKRIFKYVEIVERKTRVVVSCEEKEIEKLKEYKATLINAAVTGKIKVG
ncbi:restriction endonuclease subunit S [Flavobacterium sp.]|uniref:restriction endonuclease subunit S n=1 Tax=Flavobacterium sp. TaxID=239 RepID=UPI00374D12B7